MALLIQLSPGAVGAGTQAEQHDPAARTQHGKLTAAARWWWLNWTRFSQGKIEK